jgi:hypothetical protein
MLELGIKINAFFFIDAILDAYANDPTAAVSKVFEFCGNAPLIKYLPNKKRDAYFMQADLPDISPFEGRFTSNYEYSSAIMAKRASRCVKIKTHFGEVALPSECVVIDEYADSDKPMCDVSLMQRYNRDKRKSLNWRDTAHVVSFSDLAKMQYSRFMEVAAKADLVAVGSSFLPADDYLALSGKQKAETLRTMYHLSQAASLVLRQQGNSKAFAKLMENMDSENALRLLDSSIAYCWDSKQKGNLRLLIRLMLSYGLFVNSYKPLLRYSIGNEICCVVGCSVFGARKFYVKAISTKRGVVRDFIDDDLLNRAKLHYGKSADFEYSILNDRIVDDAFLRD